ncbi:fibroleukin-like [Aedes aegypti]|uniref:Uncharacterized protein n=1 Tax=Aedes aegypti TaxID=7159 RepID=A0A6I8U304_AEDAE|nr:fibroleukin-like [Aedes aegypti]
MQRSKAEEDIGEDTCCIRSPRKNLFEGYCEQDKFDGGGLVIQYRFNGSVDFYRGWKDTGTVWCNWRRILVGPGKTVHRSNEGQNFTLMIEMEDFNGGYAYAKYDRFEIGSEEEWYSLKRLGSYSGTCGRWMLYSAG